MQGAAIRSRSDCSLWYASTKRSEPPSVRKVSITAYCTFATTNAFTTASFRPPVGLETDRKSTRLNSSHSQISYAVFCLKNIPQRWTDVGDQVHSVSVRPSDYLLTIGHAHRTAQREKTTILSPARSPRQMPLTTPLRPQP